MTRRCVRLQAGPLLRKYLVGKKGTSVDNRRCLALPHPPLPPSEMRSRVIPKPRQTFCVTYVFDVIE